MTSTVSPPSANGAGRVAMRGAARGARPSVGTPVRRRWGRIGGGVLLAVVGAWIAVSLLQSAGDREGVVVVARDVGRSEVLERSDLRVVQVSVDAGVATVPAARVEELVGRATAADLFAGSLLSDAMLVAKGARIVGNDEAVVGVVLGPGDGPSDALDRGVPVAAVIRPAAGEDGEVEEVQGWVLDWSGSVRDERPVDLVVPREEAARVSAGAADGRVTVVLLGG